MPTRYQHRLQNHVADWPNGHAKCRPVPLTHIKASGFLGKRINANLNSILIGLKSALPRGFEARAKGEEPGPECNRLAADSDLYKWIEAASYVYAYTGSEKVRKALDRIARLVVACQKDDGYINTQVPPKKRFDTSVNHDLYIAGHFFEAAVAHYRATGETVLLKAACRWADYLLKQYKNKHPYFETVGQKEHPECELGLLRLYRATGNKNYLDFSIALAKMCTVGSRVADVRAGGGLHAVRVGYLLTSYADLYLETGREDFLENLSTLWNELVSTRLYVTGGVGYLEAIPMRPFFLPQSIDNHPDRDIAETCASIALMMFSWRMHSITAQNRYFDVIENILYNHFLGAISLNNLGIFYYNPLRVVGDQTGMTDHWGPKTRRTMLPKIHSTACCISNSWRFLGALPEYIYSYDERGLFINLYTTGSVFHTLENGIPIVLSIETTYPHDGKVIIRVHNDQPARFALRLRIPSWCKRASIAINGRAAETPTSGKYFTIDRIWSPGDMINLSMEMPVRMLYSDSRITDNIGQVAFARGPLVFCLEQQDVDFPIERARVAMRPDEVVKLVQVEWNEDLLDGVNVLRMPGIVAPDRPTNSNWPYFEASSVGAPTELMLIPFYARANRSDDKRWMTFIPLSPNVTKKS